MRRQGRLSGLVFILLLGSIFCTCSVAAAAARPVIEYFMIPAVNDPVGSRTLPALGVIDPDGSVPDTIASIIINGPNGFSYSFTPSDFDACTTDEYWHWISGHLADGEYSLTVTDINGNVSKAYKYLTVGQTIPVPDNSKLRATGANPLTPTLSWSTVKEYPGNLFYRVKIIDANDCAVWYSSRTYNSTSVTIPSGKLKVGEAYRWRSEAWDNASGSDSNNRSNNEYVPLDIDNTQPYLGRVTVNRIHNSDDSISTLLTANGGDPAGVVHELTVIGPSLAYTMQNCGPNDCVNTVPLALGSGLYTFAKKNEGGETLAESYFYFTPYSVPLVVSDTCRASGDELAPTLSWSSPASIDRPLYYQVLIRDSSTDALVWSYATNLNTSVTVPAGILQPEVSYQWQVVAHDMIFFAHANKSNSTLKPLVIDNSAPYFTYASAYGRYEASGHFAAFNITVGNPSGTLPSSIKSLVVSGPNGFSYTFQPDEYSATENEYFKLIPGGIEEGLYSFTITNINSISTTTYCYHKKDRGPIPLFDENSFQVSGDPLAPTISWNSIPGYSKPIYYRIRIEDCQGNRIYTSPYSPAPLRMVPEATLFQGQCYRYRVEAVDTGYYAYNNRTLSSFRPMSAQMTPVFMLLLE